MTHKPQQDRTTDQRLSDLERRLEDLEGSTRVNLNCLLQVLGSLVGSLHPDDQRVISDFVLRPSSPQIAGVDKLVVDERVAQLADALDRFADVYRDLRRALAERGKQP